METRRFRSSVLRAASCVALIAGCAAQRPNEVVRLLPPLRDNVSAMVENRLLALNYRVVNTERRLHGFTLTAIKREVEPDFTAHLERLVVSVTDVRAAIGSPNAGELRGHNIRVTMASALVDPDGVETVLEPSELIKADVEALLRSLGAN